MTMTKKYGYKKTVIYNLYFRHFDNIMKHYLRIFNHKYFLSFHLYYMVVPIKYLCT